MAASLTSLVSLTMSSFQGSMRSVLSKTRDTLVKSAGFLVFPPSNMRSVSLPARMALELLGPRTNRIASAMLDFPEPFGPVTAMYPSMRGMVIFPPKDLKFSSSICFKYIFESPRGDVMPGTAAHPVHPLSFRTEKRTHGHIFNTRHARGRTG